ncbi:hypothetical protein [Pseudomonas phage KP1]|uniref:Rz protein n=1 Tax=Pseudomonas phage KP1 TaxID=2562463 RepID=A0A6G5QAI8_9CAUD|nr:Rz-like spanin [Pseudomonas phage KP1]QBZ71721.1 hypothetical protein [Pseudomonas phage KP1]
MGAGRQSRTRRTFGNSNVVRCLAMIAALWAKFGKWFALAAAALVTLASIFYAGRKSGETNAEANAAEQRASDREAIAVRQINEQREASKQEVETVQGASDVKDKTSVLTDAAVSSELHDKWSRD